jgi:hypothetical protein
MKFKIIATVVVIFFLIVLTVLFHRPTVQTDADGNPVEVQTQ